ncbi:MAG: NADH-quinone oxidoreductase subunit M, partial [Planctomycetaceae bacterium]|nr:NADH-quinone oxidoreductase subunit M [Planctomycetaceae bacterium]
MNETALLSIAIFLPTLGALALLFFDKAAVEGMRITSLVFTVLTFLVTVAIWYQFDPAVADMQLQTSYEWIPGWNINYHLGVDGISLPLVLLTGLVSMLAMIASWSITKYVRGYLMLFLLLETGMMGVFL